MAEIAFAGMIVKERERLTKAREEAIAKKNAIDSEIQSIDKEMVAVDAYEAAKSGKLTSYARRGAGSARAPRGQRKQSIIDLLQRNSAGLSRGDIIDKLGAKGNKTEEQGVSNALHALKKAKKLTTKDGKYLVKG